MNKRHKICYKQILKREKIRVLQEGVQQKIILPRNWGRARRKSRDGEAFADLFRVSDVDGLANFARAE